MPSVVSISSSRAGRARAAPGRGRRAGSAEASAPGCDVELVLQLPVRAAEVQVDPRPEAAVDDLPVGRQVRLPASQIVADHVVDPPCARDACQRLRRPVGAEEAEPKRDSSLGVREREHDPRARDEEARATRLAREVDATVELARVRGEGERQLRVGGERLALARRRLRPLRPVERGFAGRSAPLASPATKVIIRAVRTGVDGDLLAPPDNEPTGRPRRLIAPGHGLCEMTRPAPHARTRRMRPTQQCARRIFVAARPRVSPDHPRHTALRRGRRRSAEEVGRWRRRGGGAAEEEEAEEAEEGGGGGGGGGGGAAAEAAHRRSRVSSEGVGDAVEGRNKAPAVVESLFEKVARRHRGCRRRRRRFHRPRRRCFRPGRWSSRGKRRSRQLRHEASSAPL